MRAGAVTLLATYTPANEQTWSWRLHTVLKWARGALSTLHGSAYAHVVRNCRSDIRAIRHLDEFVARKAGRTVRRDHLSPTNLTVRRMLIGHSGFLVRNFVQSAAMRAVKCLSHARKIS